MSKKNFGLAAQLVRPRESATVTIQKPSPSTDLPNRVNQSSAQLKASDPESAFEPFSEVPGKIKPKSSEAIHAPAFKKRSSGPGRPRRADRIERINLVLAADLRDYAMTAWRTYRKKSGEYVNGPSGFIEDLILQHREATASIGK